MQSKQYLTITDNPIERDDLGNLVSRGQVHQCRCYWFRVHSPHDFPNFNYNDMPGVARFNNHANRQYYARLYQPDSATTDVAIIYNGLDETVFQLEQDVLFGFYDRLGESLANNGIQAILLPTPYHLNRAMCYANSDLEATWRSSHPDEVNDYLVPTNSLIQKPDNIYRNHLLGYIETLRLADVLTRSGNSGIVSQEVETILTDRLVQNVEISLIGYSLGGLRALTEFVHNRLSVSGTKASKFTSCIALSSGGALSDLPSPYWVNSGKWSQMINDMMTMTTSIDTLIENVKVDSKLAEAHFSVLEDVFLGKARSFQKLEEKDPHAALDVLFMVGGGDDLVPLSSLQRFAPNGGINVLQISQLGHMYRYGALRRWERAVSNLVTDFIRATSETHRTQAYPERYASTVALLDHTLSGKSILPYNVDLEDRSVIEAAVTRLQELEQQDAIIEFILGEVYCDESVSASSIHFVKYLIHAIQTLSRMVRDRECHPGTYKRARRQILFGWHVSRHSGLVDQWQALAEDDMLLGEKLVKLGVISPQQREAALNSQSREVDRIRLSVVRDAQKWIAAQPLV